ncbi:hypothetical protein ANANG_G00194850 [Anguilla anguilla]|uniref:Calpastatin n=1 Tax=Anguilla anguilla TaxID=7936 RepID=A0A9D3M1R9_ANGAN|nr:hypothetical protein ANANG_G00194850 [Anguilla anguilla]
MPSKSRKHSRKRRRQAQRKAQAAAQVGPGGTPAAPSVAPVANGCPAPAEVVKIEDAVVNKSVPVEKTNDSPQVVPKSLSNDGALEALSAGFTKSAPIAPAEEPGSVPLDALNALSDILGSQEPEPEPPKIDPADIISERTLVTEEEAVLVGEDEDTIPPDYRFTENGTDLPPPKEEPSMDSGAALDILSGDFAAVPGAPPKQPCLEALDMLDGDFAAPAQVGLTSTPESALDLVLGSTTELGPTPNSPHHSATKLAPAFTPELASDSSSEVNPDSTAMLAPDLVPDSTSELVLGCTPELEPVAVKDRIQRRSRQTYQPIRPLLMRPLVSSPVALLQPFPVTQLCRPWWRTHLPLLTCQETWCRLKVKFLQEAWLTLSRDRRTERRRDKAPDFIHVSHLNEGKD